MALGMVIGLSGASGVVYGVTQSLARALDLFGLDLVPSRWRAEDLVGVVE